MLKAWQKVAELKSNLIQLADVLLAGELSREEVALDLLNNIEMLNNLEERLIGKIRNKTMKPLYFKCEEIELEREKSNLAVNEIATVTT
jgi:hypothetical protein